MPFLKLTSDFIFRALFVRSPDLLIDLLNSILNFKDKRQIVDINILNPELPKEFLLDKLSILDIKAQDSAGQIFNIEMQAFSQGFFVKRALYYWAKLYSNQLLEGGQYRELNKVYSINILDFNIINSSFYHSIFQLLEQSNHDIQLTEDLEMHFLELPKFKKQLQNIEENKELWLFLIKESDKIGEEVMKIIVDKSPVMEKTFHKLEELSIDPQFLSEYEMRRKTELDYASMLEEKYSTGKIEGKIEDARNLDKLGVSFDIIIRATGLTAEQLHEAGISS